MRPCSYSEGPFPDAEESTMRLKIKPYEDHPDEEPKTPEDQPEETEGDRRE